MFTKLSLTSSRYPSILTAFNHSLTTSAHGSNIFKSSSLLISRYETFINRNLDSEHVEFTRHICIPPVLRTTIKIFSSIS